MKRNASTLRKAVFAFIFVAMNMLLVTFQDSLGGSASAQPAADSITQHVAHDLLGQATTQPKDARPAPHSQTAVPSTSAAPSLHQVPVIDGHVALVADVHGVTTAHGSGSGDVTWRPVGPCEQRARTEAILDCSARGPDHFYNATRGACAKLTQPPPTPGDASGLSDLPTDPTLIPLVAILPSDAAFPSSAAPSSPSAGPPFSERFAPSPHARWLLDAMSRPFASLRGWEKRN